MFVVYVQLRLKRRDTREFPMVSDRLGLMVNEPASHPLSLLLSPSSTRHFHRRFHADTISVGKV